MNFRIIALASCVALGSIALSGKAQAQSVDVPFTGTIANICVFGAPTAGVLVRSGTLNAVEGSTGLTTGFGTGTAGSVTLACAAGGSVLTAVPTLVSAPPTFAPAVRQSVVELNSSGTFTSASSGANFDNGSWDKLTAAIVITAGVTETLNVAMVAGTNAAGTPPSGAYSYNVRLTATSN